MIESPKILLITLLSLALGIPSAAQETSASKVPGAGAQTPEPGAPAPEFRPPAQLVIAFVDMEKLIWSLPETKQRKEQLDREFETGIETLKQQMEQMNSLKDSRELYAGNTPDHLELERKIRILEVTLKLDRQILILRGNLELVKSLKLIYKRCKEGVQQVAAERGIHVVAMYSSSEVDGRNRNELIGDIITRPFIYHHPELDITQIVIDKLKL